MIMIKKEYVDDQDAYGYDVLGKEKINPCAAIEFKEGVIVDIPFGAKHIRFENLTAEQAGYLLQISEFYQLSSIRKSTLILTEELKQETLEEAAENFFNNTRFRNYKTFFCEGAKWQAERMYSEEEVEEYLNYYETTVPVTIKQWFEQFEQFKKK